VSKRCLEYPLLARVSTHSMDKFPRYPRTPFFLLLLSPARSRLWASTPKNVTILSISLPCPFFETHTTVPCFCGFFLQVYFRLSAGSFCFNPFFPSSLRPVVPWNGPLVHFEDGWFDFFFSWSRGLPAINFWCLGELPLISRYSLFRCWEKLYFTLEGGRSHFSPQPGYSGLISAIYVHRTDPLARDPRTNT